MLLPKLLIGCVTLVSESLTVLQWSADYPVTPQEAKPVYGTLAAIQILMALPHFLSPESVSLRHPLPSSAKSAPCRTDAYVAKPYFAPRYSEFHI